MSKSTAGSVAFNIRDFLTYYGTPEQCLAYLVRLRWPDGITCRTCERVTPHHLIRERKCYSCQECGTQTYPTAGTIFENSKVPLPDWFYVIFQFSKTRTGIPAKQIQRELGVSYPTALRMCRLIREHLAETPDQFTGTVECDETYMGNSRRYFGRKRKRGRGADKRPVFGIIERGGAVVAKVVPNCQRDTVLPIVREHVAAGSEVFTDEYVIYRTLPEEGYLHDTVNHKAGEYVRYREDGEKVHTNEMEGFWSYPKNAIKGVHRGVSDRHLQGYINEYAFRQSHRKDEDPMFFTMLRKLVGTPYLRVTP